MSMHRLIIPRLVGYAAPLIVLIALALWFRPQNQMGWTAVGIGALLACMVSLATFTQARSEVINKRAVRHHQAESISLMEQPREVRFIGQYGQQDMGYWLTSQP